mmetsp:Transcript_42738/g.92228  ORF Transcript_42738/g.92228 Transcript_42738/m.92228 type:complete len:223 (+) Transcript_42738:139-807(+)
MPLSESLSICAMVRPCGENSGPRSTIRRRIALRCTTSGQCSNCRATAAATWAPEWSAKRIKAFVPVRLKIDSWCWRSVATSSTASVATTPSEVQSSTALLRTLGSSSASRDRACFIAGLANSPILPIAFSVSSRTLGSWCDILLNNSSAAASAVFSGIRDGGSGAAATSTMPVSPFAAHLRISGSVLSRRVPRVSLTVTPAASLDWIAVTAACEPTRRMYQF